MAREESHRVTVTVIIDRSIEILHRCYYFRRFYSINKDKAIAIAMDYQSRIHVKKKSNLVLSKELLVDGYLSL
ncbi:hypothetical protein V1477_017623 [Vespula maculifrons]|uniref:Uncharacterized protein n=1 Tax=Vespula maculifrons TaxID=7453 RepID=A0ABD2B6K6_VESMC